MSFLGPKKGIYRQVNFGRKEEKSHRKPKRILERTKNLMEFVNNFRKLGSLYKRLVYDFGRERMRSINA